MSTLTLTLAESQVEFVARQAALGGFESAEAYIGSLIAFAEREAARARLEQVLLEGLDSGPPIEVNDEYWEDLKRRVRERRQTPEVIP